MKDNIAPKSSQHFSFHRERYAVMKFYLNVWEASALEASYFSVRDYMLHSAL